MKRNITRRPADLANAEQAFVDLVQTHQQIITRVVRHFAYEDVDRDDLRQEITGQLWRSFASFAGRARLSTWVYRVALNVAITQHRRRRRHDANLIQPDDGELEQIAAAKPEPDERLEILDQFLASIGEFDRALVLLYLDDHSHQEIAESLGISATNVSTRLNRLKTRFKQQTPQTEERDGPR